MPEGEREQFITGAYYPKFSILKAKILMITSNFVDILEGQTQGFVSGAGRWQDGIQSLQQCCSTSIALFALNLPSLEPAHL